MALYGFTQDYQRNQSINKKLEGMFTGNELEIAKQIKSNWAIFRNYKILILQSGVGGAVILGLGSAAWLPMILDSVKIQGTTIIALLVIGFIIGRWIGSKIYTKKCEHLKASVNSCTEDFGADIRLAALFHDIGKAETFSLKERIRFDHHAEKSAEIVGKVFTRLQMPGERIRKIQWIIEHHMMMDAFAKLSDERKA